MANEPESGLASHADHETFRRRLVAGSIVAILAIFFLATWNVMLSYDDLQASSRIKTQSFAKAMQAQVEYTVDLAELSLDSFAAALKSLPNDSALRADAVKRILNAPGAELGREFWMLFVNANGIGVAASNNYNVQGVSYRDRDYFRVHIDGAFGNGLYIGQPDVGRVSKRRNFFISKRIVNAQGVFVGVLAAPIDASRFAAHFDMARFTDDLSVTLIHADKKVIARHPLFESSFARDISGATLFKHLPHARTGTFVTNVSAIDNVARMISYRQFERHPLIITAGISAAVWQRALLHDAVTTGAGFLFIVAVIISSTVAALRSYQRLVDSHAQQQQLTNEVGAAQEKLFESERLLRVVTDHIPAMVSYIDLDQRFVFSNSAHQKWSHHPLAQLEGHTLNEVYDQATYRLHRENFDVAAAGDTAEFEFEQISQGATKHLVATYIPQFDERGAVIGVCSMIHDITPLKRIEQELTKLARYDALTGLPNRYQLQQRLQEAINRSARSGTLGGVLFLDIDQFKAINDTFGHHAGDIVLKEFGARLVAAVRSTDLVSRLAGDEFVIVLEGLNAKIEIAAVSEKIVQAMRLPFHIGGQPRVISTSIGAAVFSRAGSDQSLILRSADEAMYRAKQEGRNQVRFAYI